VPGWRDTAEVMRTEITDCAASEGKPAELEADSHCQTDPLGDGDQVYAPAGSSPICGAAQAD
jgi:hypothetical protein